MCVCVCVSVSMSVCVLQLERVFVFTSVKKLPRIPNLIDNFISIHVLLPAMVLTADVVIICTVFT